MLKTFQLSFALRNTYRVNAILYALKQIPLLGRILPYDIYRIQGFKVLANILSFLYEIISAFLGKILYFLLMIILPITLYKIPSEQDPSVFMHIFVVLTIIGAFLNSYLFNPTKDNYYSIILLGMDAKEYALVNYFYSLIKLALGFFICAFSFGIISGLRLWECILIPLFAVGLKIAWAAYDLREYQCVGTVRNENKVSKIGWIAIALLLAVAYGLPAIDLVLPRILSTLIMGIGFIAGVIGFPLILGFKHYRAMYKEMLTESLSTQMDKSAQIKLQQTHVNKMIGTDTSVSSNKTGFAYLNDLFIKRHQRILWSTSWKITIGSIIIFAMASLAIMRFPKSKEGINLVLQNFLPCFIFVMYMINRGVGFTRALFINCDHSLLTYAFYRDPKNILQLFRIRLYEIVKINLLPSFVIGVGLAFLLFYSGGTDNPVNYVLIIVTIIALSIFFSIHYLTLYYLIQPYNAETETKSGTYTLLVWLTYFLCIFIMRLELSTLYFGITAIIFCLLYGIVACILVYKLAPKTFRIRI